MATTTTNLGLTKPDYTDAADIAVINTNMDTVDTAITATKSDLGIVEDGNTATHSITAGQYVIWKGKLYTARSAIARGTTLSTSNLTAVSNGGLNSLNEQIGNVHNWTYGGVVTGSNVLTLPVSNWKELYIEFSLYGNAKLSIPLYIGTNRKAEMHFTVTGFISQTEITAAGLSITPHLLWVDVYSHSQNLLMLEANSEDGIVNYAMNAWYR